MGAVARKMQEEVVCPALALDGCILQELHARPGGAHYVRAVYREWPFGGTKRGKSHEPAHRQFKARWHAAAGSCRLQARLVLQQTAEELPEELRVERELCDDEMCELPALFALGVHGRRSLRTRASHASGTSTRDSNVGAASAPACAWARAWRRVCGPASKSRYFYAPAFANPKSAATIANWEQVSKFANRKSAVTIANWEQVSKFANTQSAVTIANWERLASQLIVYACVD
jgi:hypothetical protein